jgi:hypothetical protein
MRYLQSVGDHSVEQFWNVVVFYEERRTKPLRMILQMLANPFTCPLSEWPNEGKRALWQNPDIGLTSGGVHCLRMCSIVLDTSRHLGSSFFSGNRRAKFLKMFRAISAGRRHSAV